MAKGTYPIITGVTASGTSATIYILGPSNWETTCSVYVYNGSTLVYSYGPFYLGRNSTVTVNATGLSNNTTYQVRLYEYAAWVDSRTFTTNTGGSSSGGGSVVPSAQGIKGNGGGSDKTAAPYTYGRTSVGTIGTAGPYVFSEGTSWQNNWNSYTTHGSLAVSNWSAYTWVTATCSDYSEDDLYATFTITQGAKTQNYTNYPWHGILISFTDEDNDVQTYYRNDAISSGPNWNTGSGSDSTYQYTTTAGWANNTIILKYSKSLSAAYSRWVVIDLWSLGGTPSNQTNHPLNSFGNKMCIRLDVPKRTKLIANIDGTNGATYTVSAGSISSDSQITVSSGTSTTFTAQVASGCSFLGWYNRSDIDANGQPVSGASPVSTSTTYTKSITSDTFLYGVVDGYIEPKPFFSGLLYYNNSGTWQPGVAYINDGGTWKEGGAMVVTGED